MINLKDGLINIFEELKQECKIVNKQLTLIYPLTIFFILGLIVACWWWHQDYIVLKQKQEKYLQDQEKYFKNAGMQYYKIWQSFNDNEGQEILNPNSAVELRSENY